jgi:hypothetical protein
MNVMVAPTVSPGSKPALFDVVRNSPTDILGGIQRRLGIGVRPVATLDTVFSFDDLGVAVEVSCGHSFATRWPHRRCAQAMAIPRAARTRRPPYPSDLCIEGWLSNITRMRK